MSIIVIVFLVSVALVGVIYGFGLSFTAAIIPLFLQLKSAWKKYKEPIEKTLEIFQKNLEERESSIELRQKITEQEKERTTIDEDSKIITITQLEQEIIAQKAHVEKLKQQISLTANYQSLEEFINARLEDNTYEKQLGMLHQVKKDIEQLTDCLTIHEADPYKDKKQKLFPRGSARIIVYIDDLDRCPPDKVIQVLEAVQLLIKTKLFVVVLAIDDRYIARTLEKEYQSVLKRKAKPSGIDYLEKIIQIPYRMRPLSPNNLKEFLESMLKDDSKSQDNSEKTEKEADTSNTKKSDTAGELTSSEKTQKETYDLDVIREIIKFTEDEIKLIIRCTKHVDITPRIAKRLANIYKIIKYIWVKRGQIKTTKETENCKLIVISFLALSGRYPQFMRSLLEEIDTQFEEKSDIKTNDEDETNIEKMTWNIDVDLLDKLEDKVTINDSHAQREWRKFKKDIHRMLDDRITVDRDTFNLTHSFCFVGDIGYDPQDFRIEYVNNN